MAETHESFESALPASPERNGLPHSQEAEEMLLSCALIDPSVVLPRCIEQQVTPESFYDRRSSVVYEQLLSLHVRRHPIDISIVAEELNSSGKMAEVGGYAYLSQVSRLLPTTAEFPSYISRVREFELRRRLVRGLEQFAEKARNPEASLDEIAQSSTDQLRGIQQGTSDLMLERLERTRYDPLRRIPPSEPVLWLGKVAISRKANISSITAQSKSGKSSFVSGLLASTFRDPDHGRDCFSARGPNPAGRALLHIDTEQAPQDHQRMMDIVLKRAGADLPLWFHSYCRKGTSAEQLRAELNALLRSKSRLHNGIHAVFLDGIADYVNDVNDPKDVNPFVAWLESLSVQFDCPILNVLHLNPLGNRQSLEKARGHLGSQLQRKGETDLRLRKDADGVTVVFTDPAGTRHEPIMEKDGIRFAWDHDEHMHVSCSGRISSKEQGALDRARELAAEIWGNNSQRLRYSDVLKAIQTTTDVGPSRAEARFTEMKKAGCIEKDMLGFWGLVDKKG